MLGIEFGQIIDGLSQIEDAMVHPLKAHEDDDFAHTLFKAEGNLESAGLFSDDGSLRLTFGTLNLVLNRERLSALLNTELDNEAREEIERKLNLVNEQLRESAAREGFDSDICSMLHIASG